MVHLLLRGQPLMSAGKPANIRAVLFDKDGTLSRSEPHLLAIATTRIQHCLNLSNGRSHSDKLEQLLQCAFGVLPEVDSLDPGGITAVAAREHNLISTAVVLTLAGHSWPEAQALAQETFRLADLDHPPGSACSPMTDGLAEFLAALHLSNVRCAVISNDDRAGIHSFLEHHGLYQQINAIWSAEHQPRKPDPRAIQLLCEELGVAPANCALIGDANSDLHMARAAGVAVVLGYRGGWQQSVSLEADYPWMEHWSELAVDGDIDPASGVSTGTCPLPLGA
ncbi:MAG: HAD family hydrolase [Cyanobacteriota bacterium]|jgi:phosphoglycolate phosphatase